MELKSDSFLYEFADQNSVKRTSQNDIEFAPLEERGLVQRTLGGCWVLTAAGRRALDRDTRPVAAKSVPPIFAPELDDSSIADP